MEDSATLLRQVDTLKGDFDARGRANEFAYHDPGTSSTPRIENIVASGSLGCRLDIPRLMERLGGRFITKDFGRGLHRIRQGSSRATILIFRTGYILCIGCNSVVDTLLAFETCCLQLTQELGRRVAMRDFVKWNLVASDETNTYLDVALLAQHYPETVVFDADVFSGARISVPGTNERDNMRIIAFPTGKFIMTGTRSVKDLERGVAMIAGPLRAHAIVRGDPRYRMLNSRRHHGGSGTSPFLQREAVEATRKRIRAGEALSRRLFCRMAAAEGDDEPVADAELGAAICASAETRRASRLVFPG